jgi:hypothetical protein
MNVNIHNQDMICLARFLFPGETERKAVADVLLTAPAAERICRLKYGEGDHRQDVCLQVHRDRTVVSGMQEEDSFEYELKEPGELKRACYYLFNCFGFELPESPESSPEEVPAMFMSRRKYEELAEKAGSFTLYLLTECLKAETGDHVNSTGLAKVLKSSTGTGELRLCSQGSSGWSYQQASYLEDASGGWLLRMSCETSQDWMVAVPLTKVEMCSALYEWALQPAPVANPE